MYADSNNSMEGCNGVLFEIEIDPQVSSSPFISINADSQFPLEDEILFSTNTIFHIDRVTVGNDGLYHVNLSLTSNHDKNLCELIVHRRKEIEGRTSVYRLAHLLYRMGKFNKAKEIYQQLLGIAVSLDDTLYINYYLARIHCQMGNFDKALSQQALSLQFNNGRNPSLTADLYAGMGEAFLRHDMLENSLEFYEKALEIAERSQGISDHSKVSYLNNIGFVLKLQNHYDKAKIYFQRALDIALARFPRTHPDIANLYQNIGSLYFDMGDFHSSIDYLNKSLRSF
jgi:tetratricopeptide (TPR) repeat protein